jgi:hypothetical protein
VAVLLNVVLRQPDRTLALTGAGRAERFRLRRRARRRVGDGEEGKDGAEDDGRRPGARRAVGERVADASRVIVVGDGRSDEVGRVERNDGGLGEARLWVGLLDGGRDGRDRQDDRQDEVGRDEEGVGLAVAAAKEDEEDDSKGNREDEGAKGRANEDELPDGRVGVLPARQERLGERVGKVDEKEKAEQDE